jgi:hypothetical protein
VPAFRGWEPAFCHWRPSWVWSSWHFCGTGRALTLSYHFYIDRGLDAWTGLTP